ncbi:aquaporin-10b isoform X2 [Esox lucius]|uniref:aquaporin-10b isoform X2 n=1 Tax=Esox lucius TaxID=8010 RepID=UPI0009732133|nr:aquaporin-10b isoform X2 [Esox lucius]
MDQLLKKCQIRSNLLRECLAECLGVYIMILLGCGSVAQVTTSKNSKGHYLSINLGFALGTTFGIYVSRGVSGAHLNPAVSLSLCFLDAIRYYSGGHLSVTGPTATAGIFSTYPADYLSLWGGILDQVVGTAVLMVCILALGDSRNSPAPAGLEPVLVGAVVLVIGISMGSNSGYSLNPARDIGPRLFTYIAGWGDEVFRAGCNWWWVPLVATCVGALVGTLIYELLIEVHHPENRFISESSTQGKATVSNQAVELSTVNAENNYHKDRPDGIKL